MTRTRHMKRLKTFMAEAVRTAKLYHRGDWKGILYSGDLMTSAMDDDEMGVIGNDKLIDKYGDRYVSFARTLGGSFMKTKFHQFSCVLEFSSERLRRDYKIIPVDWMAKFSYDDDPVRADGVSEEEERLITSAESIPIGKYLDGVHIWQRDTDMPGEITTAVEAGAVAKLVSRYPNIPFWLYDDAKTFAAGRWDTAHQINPNVTDPHDEDDYDEET